MSKKTIEETYQKLSQKDHVLQRPGMYIGSTDQQNEELWVFNNQNNKIEKKIIKYTPGFIKIFDEILTNATDHASRDDSVNLIKVTYDKESGEISVWNNGKGIPIVVHKEHNIYIPELIFGHLLSGSNYNDSDERTGAGTNGLGSKCTNLFSKIFTVETVDSEQKLKFVQTHSNNMSEKTKAKITKYSNKSYTKITFVPDYKRFNMNCLDDDTISLLSKRVLDCIACTRQNVKIYLNDVELKGKGIQDYAKYFFDDNVKKIYDNNNNDKFFWEWVVIPYTEFQQVSFVNGNCTYLGGKHIDYLVSYQIVNKLKNYIETKKKIKDIKPSFIKDKLFIFLRSTIKNPTFSSQTKEQLTTQVKDFGCKIEISDKFIEKLYKSSIVDEIVELCKLKEAKEIKGTDGRKTSKLYIPKLEDAIWAGTSKSDLCTLILTEGDSAKTFAMWGRSMLEKGVEKYGIYSLRGKVMNIRDATNTQLMNNEEINNLKQIIGLKHDKLYSDVSELRYGKILILTDADLDGSHIKCLIVNLFHVWWPNILKLNYIQTLRTPIVVITKGKNKKEFYTEGDYNKWKAENNQNNWSVKYYKGLGTSSKQDAQNIFLQFNNLRIDYYYNDDKCDNAIVLAFEKDKNIKSKNTVKLTDQRKEWLQTYNKNIYIDSSVNKISYKDLIDKELIHFSIYDNMRSIPNMIDGLKPSQRKIMHYMIEKGSTTKEIKVAQLSGYVSAETNYHHGEASLQQAIISLAQNFVGTNNLSFLMPLGNFGSRYTAGDAASPRYIFTKLSSYTPLIFDNRDKPLLDYIIDDGDKVEPEYFVPIIPTVLVNGVVGIGTGYSTNIPPFNPVDIIKNIYNFLDNKPFQKIKPYFKGFNGTIEINDFDNKYVCKGVYKRIGPTTIQITELPVGTWITGYKQFLESMIESNNDKKNNTIVLKDVVNKTKDDSNGILIEIEFKNKDDIDKMINNETFEKEMKLTKQISINNMCLFNNKSILVKYDTIDDILTEFCNIRLNFYKKRKEYILKLLEEELKILKSKMKFINDYMNDIIIIHKKSKSEILKQLDDKQYHKVDNTYDYLIRLPIVSLSKDKIEELQNIIDSKTIEYKDLKSKDIKTMWKDDLEKLKKIIQ